MDDDANREEERELSPQELRRWAEFCCWITLGLAPLLYWLNGPAVSTDQFVVRIALVVIATAGAFGLRLFAWLCRTAQ